MPSMKFQILPRWEIEKPTFLFSEFYILISIVDWFNQPVRLPEDRWRLDTLHLKFDDIEKVAPNSIASNHAVAILKFVEEYKNKVGLIVCQCEAGISRSSGCAAAIAQVLGELEASKAILNDVQYNPNLLVLSTILDVFYNHKEFVNEQN